MDDLEQVEGTGELMEGIEVPADGTTSGTISQEGDAPLPEIEEDDDAT